MISKWKEFQVAELILSKIFFVIVFRLKDPIINLIFFFNNFQEKFAGVDIRVRVSGGGHVAQIYAIRQAISKALIAFYQKCKFFLEIK